MTLKQIETLLKSTGFPVAYHHFNKPPKAPYIVFIVPFTPTISADDKVLVEVNHLQIELYTHKKSPTAESKVKKMLDDSDLPYEKSETYINSEKLYQIIYECEVI